MKAVSKSKEALDLLIRIMSYEDKDYYIYRCAVIEVSDEFQENEYFVAMLYGDVAWSCDSWFDRIERIDETIESGGNYVTLDILCERLGIAVEVFGAESGMEFQEHYLCNPKGDVLWNECVGWHQDWFDEDGDGLLEPIESGGFDYYCDFDTASAIYNAV
jgi:hypothetical protein